MHPPPAALAELKHWLAITTTADDAALSALILSALGLCEAFTGQRPLVAELSETVSADGRWHTLDARPVRAIAAVTHDGAALPSAAFEVDIDIQAAGHVRAAAPDVRTVEVTLTAGLAHDWADLPEPLRHGVIRLAAALYRARGEDAPAMPPAAVAALWRPWRRMRLV